MLVFSDSGTQIRSFGSNLEQVAYFLHRMGKPHTLTLQFGTTRVPYTYKPAAHSDPQSVENEIYDLLSRTPPPLEDGHYWAHMEGPDAQDVQMITLRGKAAWFTWGGVNPVEVDAEGRTHMGEWQIIYLSPITPPEFI